MNSPSPSDVSAYPTGSSPAPDPRMLVFYTLWAAAMLLQLMATQWLQLNIKHSVNLPNVACELVLLVAALRLLFRPGKTAPLAVAVIAQLADTVILAPEIPNHRLLTAAVNLLLLATVLRSRWTHCRAAAEPFLPGARAGVVVVYAFAALHKLNSGFFYIPESCATVFYRHIREIIPSIPLHPTLLGALPLCTVIAEGLLMAGLLSSRYRSWFALFGIIFHFSLALDLFKHFFDFSSTMIALLVLFIPPQTHAALCQTIAARKTLAKGWRVILILFYCSILFAGFFSGRGEHYYYFSRIFLWLLFAIPVVAMFAAAIVQTRRVQTDPVPRVSGLWWCFPILIFLNGISPYLGIKTRSAWDMYSNLRVENGASNHYLLPSLDLFELLRDPVQIIETDDPALQDAIVAWDLRMTRSELARYYDHHPRARTVIFYQGERRILDDRIRAELAPPPSLLLGKLLWFRPLEAGPIERCKW